MLQAGGRLPDATLWAAPRQTTTTQELLAEGPLLIFFYLFDWSAT